MSTSFMPHVCVSVCGRPMTAGCIIGLGLRRDRNGRKKKRRKNMIATNKLIHGRRLSDFGHLALNTFYAAARMIRICHVRAVTIFI